MSKIKKVIETILFGKPIKGSKLPKPKVYTTFPDETTDFNQWANKLQVSSKAHITKP